MANRNSNTPPIDPNSGFCSETKLYHSLRPRGPLPPETQPLSVTDYVFTLLRHNTPSPEINAIQLIDALTHHRIPYTQLISRTKSLAASLQQQFRLSRGDTAFVLSPNSIHLPILYLSLLSLGVIVSPSNPASSQSEISSQINLCKPVIAFATFDTAHKVPSLTHPTILLDSLEFESMMRNPNRELAGVCVLQSDTAAILYSSGTTGKFKGVELTHRNFISMLANSQASRPVRASPAVTFCAVPYFHIYGFIYTLRMVAMGNSLVCVEKFDLGVMIRAIEEFKVTNIALAPPVILNMVKGGSDLVGDRDLSSLEMVGSGGASLPTTVIERFQTMFPAVQLVQGYGLTETTSGVSLLMGPEETKRSASCGRLVAYCEAKVVDLEDGASLPPLKQGELWVRSPFIMKGYVNDKEATSAILDSEGWLRTGDICYFDNEGFLYVVDRLKELIKYKGYQVAPFELENLLQTHPDVVESAVVPYPDEEAGQVPMAFIVRRPGSNITESKIKDFVARQVAPYKKIRRVSFVSSIPKNAPGKVMRKELIKLALSDNSSKL